MHNNGNYRIREEQMLNFKGLRKFWNGAALAVMLSSAASISHASELPDISIAINQSPWLNSFIAMVDEYESETGNKINLDVTPFAGLLEKIRNSVRSSEGTYDIVNVNSGWLAEIYDGGFLAPLDNIKPGYALQDDMLDFGATTNWNAASGTFGGDGALMGVPVNGNVQVLYYNTEIYDRLGLKVPGTWDDLIANATAIQAEGETFGFVPRSGRSSIVYNFTPYLFSNGGSFIKQADNGSIDVMINSAESLKGLVTYLALIAAGAPPNPGAIEQGELIQLLSTGSAAQAIAVIGAWGNLEDPDKSIVGGKINAALLPAGPDGTRSSAAGHWVAGIPANVPPERQQAALAFLDWFQSKEVQTAYVEAGGVPVRSDLSDALKDDPRYRFIAAWSENASHATMGLPVTEGAEISDAVAVFLNRAVIGEISAKEALNSAADAIKDILTRDGVTVRSLPKL